MRVIIFYTYMYFFFKELFAYVELGAAGEQSKQPYRGQLCHRALPHVWLQDGALHGCGGGWQPLAFPLTRHQGDTRQHPGIRRALWDVSLPVPRRESSTARRGFGLD